MNRRLRRLACILPALGSACFLGDYDIPVVNESRWTAQAVLDGDRPLTVPSGGRETFEGVNRDPHQLDIELVGSGLPTQTLQLPKLPDGAAVFVCVIITEQGPITQSDVERCQVGGGGSNPTNPDAPLVALTRLERVPIGVPTPVQVTIQPTGPTSDPVELSIEPAPGATARAVFAPGASTSLTLTASGLLQIEGVTHSSDAGDVLRLVARHRGAELTSQTFSVRTWPTGMVLSGHAPDSPSRGKYTFEYELLSESGRRRDLDGLIVGETVDYPGDGPLYEFASPPYRAGPLGVLHPVDDPYTDHLVLSPQVAYFYDTHHVPTTDDNDMDPFMAFRTPYRPDVIQAEQHYWFEDPVLPATGRQQLLGPMYIVREVYEDPSGSWWYAIRKRHPDGQVHTLTLPLP